MQLKEKVKYTDIEKGIKKKILYDLEKEKIKAKTLDIQNQKLFARIENLSKVKKNIPFPQIQKYNSIFENSLSFSL